MEGRPSRYLQCIFVASLCQEIFGRLLQIENEVAQEPHQESDSTSTTTNFSEMERQRTKTIAHKV